MGYKHFRYARRIDADTLGIYHNDLTELLEIDKATADQINIKSALGTGKNIAIFRNNVDTRPYLKMDTSIYFDLSSSAYSLMVMDSGGARHYIRADGVHFFLEASAPTAKTNYGAIWTQTDNKLYFQSGDGNNHEVAFV